MQFEFKLASKIVRWEVHSKIKLSDHWTDKIGGSEGEERKTGRILRENIRPKKINIWQGIILWKFTQAQEEKTTTYDPRRISRRPTKRDLRVIE